MDEHETERPSSEEQPESDPVPPEDTDLEVGWEEKGMNNGDVDDLPVEDSAEPVDWLEEGEVVAERPGR